MSNSSRYYRHLKNGTLRTHYEKYDNYQLNLEKSIRTKMKRALLQYRSIPNEKALNTMKVLWKRLYNNLSVKTESLPEISTMFKRYSIKPREPDDEGIVSGIQTVKS